MVPRGARFHNTWKQVAFSRVIAPTDSANSRSLCTKRRELRWRGNAMFFHEKRETTRNNLKGRGLCISFMRIYYSLVSLFRCFETSHFVRDINVNI